MSTRPDTIVAIVDPLTGRPDMTVAVVGDNVVDLTGATAGQVLTVQPDGSVAADDPFDLDAMRFKGVINASTNPNYPAASAGDVYRISVAGKIGGASGTNVEVGDLILAIADNAGGTQAAVGTSWSIEQANIDGAVVGPASAVDSQLASFNGTSGKLIKDSGLALDTDGTLAANSDVKVPSQKAVKTYADAKVVDSIADADATHAPSRNAVFDALALKADLVSPALTGNPTAPTPAAGDNDTSIATSAFIAAALAARNAVVVNATNATAYTVPTGVTLLEVIAVGGGAQGGGGGSNAAGALQAGGAGGGAGAYSRTFQAVTPGDVIAVVVGAGGSAAGGGGAAGGNAGIQGSNGADTTATNGTWTATGKGGQGGMPSQASSNTSPNGGGYGGAASTAGVNGVNVGPIPGCGGPGGTSASQRLGGSPIGSSGGGGGGGGQASTTNGGLGGGGGTQYVGGAGQGSGGSGTVAGGNGSAAAANTGAGGGGGGGGTNLTGAGGNGGAGGSGYVVLRPVG